MALSNLREKLQPAIERLDQAETAVAAVADTTPTTRTRCHRVQSDLWFVRELLVAAIAAEELGQPKKVTP